MSVCAMTVVYAQTSCTPSQMAAAWDEEDKPTDYHGKHSNAYGGAYANLDPEPNKPWATGFKCKGESSGKTTYASVALQTLPQSSATT